MVVVDANVLLYAVNASSPNHRRAKDFLETSLNGEEAVGLAWVSLLAFLRISTLAALTERPLAPGEALARIEDWLEAPAARVIGPTSRHLTILKALLLDSGTAANLTSDAHLAALAMEHGGRIATFDRDFGRFGGLDWFIPE